MNIFRKRDITFISTSFFQHLHEPNGNPRLFPPPLEASSQDKNLRHREGWTLLTLPSHLWMNHSCFFWDCLEKLWKTRNPYVKFLLQLILKDGGCTSSFHAPLTCKRFETWKVIPQGPQQHRVVSALHSARTWEQYPANSSTEKFKYSYMSTSWKFRVLIQKRTYWRSFPTASPLDEGQEQPWKSGCTSSICSQHFSWNHFVHKYVYMRLQIHMQYNYIHQHLPKGAVWIHQGWCMGTPWEILEFIYFCCPAF